MPPIEITSSSGCGEKISTRLGNTGAEAARSGRFLLQLAWERFRHAEQFRLPAGVRRVDPALVTEAEAADHPPVRQPVVRDENPHGPALYLGAHARAIEGMAEAEGRALIDRLVAFAGEARFVYSHRWARGDVLVWDNRAVMHRATPFAASGERRRMVRTTVAG